MIRRAAFPRLNKASPLAKVVRTALLGGGASTLSAKDASWFGKHGSFSNIGATPWIFDPYLQRWALNFADGGTQYLDCGDPAIPINCNQFSLSVWAYRYDNANYGGLFARDTLGVGAGGRQWFLAEQTSSEIYLRIYQTNGTERAKTTSTDAFLQDNWYHIGLVIDGLTPKCTLWINGVPIDFTNASWDGTVKNGSEGLLVGAMYTAAYTFEGKLADPMFFEGNLNWAMPALADRSNVNYQIGNVPLILPEVRRVFPAAVAGGEPPAASYWLWARQHSAQVIGGGVV